MLSNEDYRKYIDQILKVEKTMSDVYSECAMRVEDREVLKALLFLLGAENRHANMVTQLKELFHA